MIAELVDILGVSQRTIYRWFDRFKEDDINIKVPSTFLSSPLRITQLKRDRLLFNKDVLLHFNVSAQRWLCMKK